VQTSEEMRNNLIIELPMTTEANSAYNGSVLTCIAMRDRLVSKRPLLQR
jgi:hypothetical protein